MGDEAVLEWELKYEELNLMFEEYKESSKEFEADLEGELTAAQEQEHELRKSLAALQKKIESITEEYEKKRRITDKRIENLQRELEEQEKKRGGFQD